MATINHSLVARELKALSSVGEGVKKLLRRVLEKIERDPAAFPILDDVPVDLALHPGVFIRKARVTLKKHDYRLVFLHRRQQDGSEHVDLLYIFKRKEGYDIDWEWIAGLVEG
jgi:hypothetical protein